MDFEWDENKRETNLAKHRLDLLDARRVFDGRAVLTYPSLRNGEKRFVSISIIEAVTVAVVWVERDAAIRLIS